MARSDLHETRFLAFEDWNLDSITNVFLGLMNGLATVRHVSGANGEIIGLFERAGLPVTEDLHLYDTGAQAERLAEELVASGRRLFFVYPLPAGRHPDSAYLVAPALWRRLNSKGALASLVPAAHLAPRALHTLHHEASAGFKAPVFLKDASQEASGGGSTVRACFDEEAWRRALAELRALGVADLVVEEALPIDRCWCVALALDETGAHYLGAAEQTFEAPGQQSGNIIDPEFPLPAGGVRLALHVAEGARQLGFRGVAGLDIGRAADGRLIVFDPNFRINSCSAQVLLHSAAARRADLPVSSAVQIQTALPFKEIVHRLKGPIDDGWFVPTRFLDAALLAGVGQSVCGGFVLAKDRARAACAETAFADILAA